MNTVEPIDKAVEERLVSHATAAALHIDNARRELRLAAHDVEVSGLPSEIHRRVCLQMEECHSVEALIGEHAQPSEVDA